MRSVFRVVLVLVLLAVVLPAALGACPLCKDAKSDSDYAGGTASLPNGFYYSILFMVCAPFLVVGGLITRIALARRRRLAEAAAAIASPAGSGEPGPLAAHAPGSGV
jgi:hypothetical protein